MGKRFVQVGLVNNYKTKEALLGARTLADEEKARAAAARAKANAVFVPPGAPARDRALGILGVPGMNFRNYWANTLARKVRRAIPLSDEEVSNMLAFLERDWKSVNENFREEFIAFRKFVRDARRKYGAHKGITIP
jgi:hypothetical protein